MHAIDIAEISKDLFDLVELALKGEEIIIVKDNQPVVKLVGLTLSDDFEEPIANFEDYLK